MTALDKVDTDIVRRMQQDGRLTNAKLATQLSLSETPCWRRLKRLEEEGIITDHGRASSLKSPVTGIGNKLCKMK